MGHSCNIGNAPNLGEKKLKIEIWLFSVYIWHGFSFTRTGKVKGKLKKSSKPTFGMIFDFFVPRRHWPFFGKIPCQSLNFICQTLGESLKFADPSYVFERLHLLSSLSQNLIFLANMWIGNVFIKFINFESIFF